MTDFVTLDNKSICHRLMELECVCVGLAICHRYVLHRVSLLICIHYNTFIIFTINDLLKNNS